MSLTVDVVGVGDAFTARYWNACLLVQGGGTRVLVDAPPALARALAELGAKGGPTVGLDDVDDVLITHLHGDHCGGLEQLLFWRRFVTRRPCRVWAIPEVLAGLWDARLRGGMDTLMDASGARSPLMLGDYCDVRPLPSTPGRFSLGDLSVEWRPTVHHIPTSALRFAHGGSRFGYSADTAYDPSLVEWLAPCDLFLHETNLGAHTPVASLAALPEATRARMRVIHYPDFFDVETSPVACAREGDRYAL